MQLYLLLLNEDMYHTKTKKKNNIKKKHKTKDFVEEKEEILLTNLSHLHFVTLRVDFLLPKLTSLKN